MTNDVPDRRPRVGPSARGRRRSTLHRLVGIEDLDAVPGLLNDAVFARGVHGRDVGPRDGERIELAGCPAVWFWAQDHEDAVPSWLADAAVTVGRDIPLRQRGCGVLIAVRVDDEIYSVTYGDAWRWICGEHRDPAFGLRVVVRCLDPNRVRGVRSKRLGQGRTDSTHVAGGAPVWAVRPSEQLDVVRKLAGEMERPADSTEAEVTRGELLEGGAGLTLMLGIRPEDLVADIRRVRALLAREVPEELRFVEAIRPAAPERLSALESWLEQVLASGDAHQELALAWPEAALDHLHAVREFGYLRNPTRKEQVSTLPDLTLEHIVGEATRGQQRGRPIDRLRRHRVHLIGEDDGKPLMTNQALAWIEAERVLDDEPHYLVEGKWFTVDAAYAASVRDDVRRAFERAQPLGLPPWRRAGEGESWREKAADSPEDEATYNEHAAEQVPALLCLDRKLVKDPLNTGQGLEVCDLLAPGGVYVHVKRAKGAAALSHLFVQGVAAVEALRNQRETRERFRAVVAAAAHAKGVDPAEYLPEDLVPERLVFAILRDGGPLTLETLYPLAATTLSQVMRRFNPLRICVEVHALTLSPVSLEQVA